MDEKELIRSKIDIVSLVGESVQLKKAGANWKGLCPFHHEKSPSFMVNPELGIFKCFGCGEGGDCFAWVMKMESVDFRDALVMLAERAGVVLEKTQVKKDDQSDAILQVLAEASRFYRYLLLSHESGQQALEYLAKRAISREAIDTFGIGWSVSAWDGLARVLFKKGFSYELMEYAGLVVRSDKGSYYDRFRGRVMFELRDVRGRVVGFAGRILVVDDKGPKYINSPETAVYHKGELLFGLDITKQSIRTRQRAVLVEGEIDAISSWQSGVTEVVALKGTALTESQVGLLGRYTKQVVIALDMDMAGDKAARRSMALLETAGIEVRMVRIPSGKDPDDMARTHPEKWKVLIDEAIEVYEFLLLSAMDRNDASTPRGKRMIVDELLPIFADIPHEITRIHWIGELSRRVGVDESVLLRQLSPRSIPTYRGADKKATTTLTRRDYLERVWLGCALQHERDWMLDEFVVNGIGQEWLRDVLTTVQNHQDDWMQSLSGDSKETVEEILLLVQNEEFLDPDYRRKLQEELKSHITKDSLTELSRALRDAEARDDVETQMNILQRIEEIRRK